MTNSNSLTSTIASELGLPARQVQTAIDLLSAGNTIPFIARYRKEATGTLDEVALRAIEDALERANTLVARKKTILKSMAEQNVLTQDLAQAIETCSDLRTLEAIYFPFKPKRQTKATLARNRGLQPLADILIAQKRVGKTKKAILQAYVDPAKEVPDIESALQGALDIVAEQWSEVAETRHWLFDKAMQFAKVTSKVKRGKKSVEGAEKFELYFEREEPVNRIRGHRVLAMLRGQAEGFLRLGLTFGQSQTNNSSDDRELGELKRRWITNRQFEFHSDLVNCAEDAYQRLLMPATESAIWAQLKESADEEAIEVFATNLRELLMAAPAGPRVTLGIDPGFRTGCKVAVVDGTGQFLAATAIYPTPPKNDIQAAGKTILNLIKEHQVELIAIGNGTASRETDAFVSDLIKDNSLDVTKVVVSESGASIYSASELAAKEFPDLDVTVRGAISIARRLQDPLAELVKTDPKSIGVGQYQHDVNQTKLKKCLDRVVQSCVNNVGVNLNMASAPLLSYVAGIGPKLAEQIIQFRNSNGRFNNRTQLSAVPKLGKKAFEQAAGFLRIDGGEQPLDNSSVHPESYPVVEQMAKKLKSDLKNLVGNIALSQKLDAAEFVDDQFGLPTVKDIIDELGKPGRDPRSEFKVVNFDDGINSIEDLRPNLVLEGVITNVTHFGAFVDLGVHQDALIHISELANEFVSDPNEVVSVGDVVKVKVLEIDVPRKRIAASRKAL